MMRTRHHSSFRMHVLVAALVALITQTSTVHGQISTDAGAQTDGGTAVAGEDVPLRVGYVGSTPFVIAGAQIGGLSIEVWRAVAEGAGLRYELQALPSIGEALAALENGALDIVIGPISITAARARVVRFTQPYFQSELGIASRGDASDFWGKLKPFVTRIFAGASLVLLLSLILVGAAVWLSERRRNAEQFPPDPLRGIANGMWFALVTMTTVGYGDRAPITTLGRLLTGIWMIVALVTTSSLTAGIASAFTVLQLASASIQQAEDLRGAKVVAVQGTTGSAFASARGARLSLVADIDEAIGMVERGEAAAVVHDKPILQYHLTHEHPSSSLQLSLVAYEPQGYGFAVAPKLDLVSRLNVALLAAREAQEVDAIARRWLGEPGT